MIVSFIT